MGGCGVVGVQGEAGPGVGSEEEEGDDSRQGERREEIRWRWGQKQNVVR